MIRVGMKTVAKLVRGVPILAAAWLCCAAPVFGVDAKTPLPRRQILVCVSEKASPEIKAAGAELLASAASVPVLRALMETQGAGPAVAETSENVLLPRNYDLAAYNHLVVIGLRSADALVDRVWEHYAAVDEAAKTLYAQGWGYLQGDLGYIESDRNPFLHSRRVKEAPFETVLIKISGTSEAGVLAAVKAFREQGVINGIVPAGTFTRPRKTILDLDPQVTPCPLTDPFTFPSSILDTAGAGAAVEAWLAGWTQVPANEYRAYIDVAGDEPTRVWRVKYLLPNALAQAKTPGWMAGLHRMAYGNAVNVIEFATADSAKKTAAAIAKSGGWRKIADIAGLEAWQADQPTDENMATSLGKVIVVSNGPCVIMSTLEPALTAKVLECVKNPPVVVPPTRAGP